MRGAVPGWRRRRVPVSWPPSASSASRTTSAVSTTIFARPGPPAAGCGAPEPAMCGIAGWVAHGPHGHDEATLAAMLDALAHRGPDGEGVVSLSSGPPGGRVYLGHRRLA